VSGQLYAPLAYAAGPSFFHPTADYHLAGPFAEIPAIANFEVHCANFAQLILTSSNILFIISFLGADVEWFFHLIAASTKLSIPYIALEYIFDLPPLGENTTAEIGLAELTCLVFFQLGIGRILKRRRKAMWKFDPVNENEVHRRAAEIVRNDEEALKKFHYQWADAWNTHKRSAYNRDSRNRPPEFEEWENVGTFRWRHYMTPIQFEQQCAEYLSLHGWETATTKGSGDFGVDIMALKRGYLVVLQCKFYSSPIGISAVQEILGARIYHRASLGVVVSNQTYTPAAIQLAERAEILLLHYSELSQIDGLLWQYSPWRNSERE
jgi:hypothetical protein